MIFDRAIYPDEDHGRVGQPRVDEVVGLVEEIWDLPAAWPISLYVATRPLRPEAAIVILRPPKPGGADEFSQEDLAFANLLVSHLRRALGMPTGSALALVAIARTAGWIAHAIEQYATGRLIRPSCRYVGPEA